MLEENKINSFFYLALHNKNRRLFMIISFQKMFLNFYVIITLVVVVVVVLLLMMIKDQMNNYYSCPVYNWLSRLASHFLSESPQEQDVPQCRFKMGNLAGGRERQDLPRNPLYTYSKLVVGTSKVLNPIGPIKVVRFQEICICAYLAKMEIPNINMDDQRRQTHLSIVMKSDISRSNITF